MYLKQLELTNFQKFEHLILDLTPGVNILHGITESGKSCIRRALEWVYFNKSIRKDGIRKEGTKQTSVKITRSDGVIVERIKSNTVNRYVLKVTGEKDKEFKSIGKEIPEEIQKVLQVRTVDIDKEKIVLNIAKQVALPFLLDKTGTFRMKLFNQLTGSDILDKVFSSLNKDILHINKVEKLEKERLKEQEGKLAEVQEKKEKAETLHKRFSEQYNKVKEKIEEYQELCEYFQKLCGINVKLAETNGELKDIKTIDETKLLNLEVCIEELKRLNQLLCSITKIKLDLSNTTEKLEAIKVPEIDLSDIGEKIDKFDRLQKLTTQLDNIKISDKKFKDKIIITTEQIEEGEAKYKELLRQCKICPTCKQEVKNIEEVKL